MKPKAVITDCYFQNVDIEIEIMKKHGIETVFLQSKDEDIIAAGCRDAEGIIAQYAPISRKVIAGLEKCKAIAEYGTGYDNIDVQAATEKGIVVINVPAYAIEEVAEHAVALLLALARKVTLLDKTIKQNIWNYNLGKPIYKIRGRTLGLVGFGNIAQNVAWRAQGLGLNVLAFDPYIYEKEMDKHKVKKMELAELLGESDFVSLHTPLIPATRHLIGEKEFAAMKAGALLVNVARGAVVDEQSLIRALGNRTIAGAALDVLETEPVASDNPLLKMDNVIITPHIAWYTEESEVRLRSKAATDVARVITGQYPDSPVNPEVLERLFGG